MHFYLIDFENVQCKTLGDLKPGDGRINVFLGENQSKLLIDFVRMLQPFGSDVAYIQISGSGPNALDFHIAFYIGRWSLQFPGADFTILSNDGGFDPLIRHLAGLGVPCKRSATIGNSSSVGPQGAKQKSSAASAKRVTAKKAKSESTVAKAETPSEPPRLRADSNSTSAMVDEVLLRLKGLKKARPARIVTLKSSIKSWFKPKLEQKQLDAVVQSLTDRKKIKITGAKVAYSLS